MRRIFLLCALVLGALAAMSALVRGPAPPAAQASSHRDAPLISNDPAADNTDLYAYRDPRTPGKLTIIANWIPAEDPAAGPMWYEFSPTARYDIYIDRTGDGRPDVTYAVRFGRSNPVAFLRSTVQPYTVLRTAHGGTDVVAHGKTPPDNIGPRFLNAFFGTTNYHQLAQSSVRPLGGGGQVFAGQRDDAFFGDIGAIFDLVGFRKDTGSQGGGKDFFAGYGVHAIALQIPIGKLDTKSHVIGIWAATDRQQMSVRRDGGRHWVQVSRLGNPLVNEVLIPTQRKDEWNRDRPAGDAKYVRYFRTPILAKLINQLYPSVKAPETNRSDLVQVLLTGVPGLNKTGNRLADMLRINLSTPPTPLAQQDRLGVLGGDLAGWPNGRRLGDDVIDIAEQAVAGELVGNPTDLGDGVNADNIGSLDQFPYEADPFSGFANTKGNCRGIRDEIGDFISPTCA
jgi:Domain of unknown function (DUF4331)